MKRARRAQPPVAVPSGFTGFRFPPEVILLAVRWYLRYGLSYWDLEELFAERGIDVDHVTLFRWVHRFTPLLIDAARPVRHLAGDRWFVDETYVKGLRGLDLRLPGGRPAWPGDRRVRLAASRHRVRAHLFTAALAVHGAPTEITTDRAPALANVIEDLVPAAWHNTGRYQNTQVVCDHGRLKARLRPMRGLKTHRTARAL